MDGQATGLANENSQVPRCPIWTVSFAVRAFLARVDDAPSWPLSAHGNANPPKGHEENLYEPRSGEHKAGTSDPQRSIRTRAFGAIVDGDQVRRLHFGCPTPDFCCCNLPSLQPHHRLPLPPPALPEPLSRGPSSLPRLSCKWRRCLAAAAATGPGRGGSGGFN